MTFFTRDTKSSVNLLHHFEFSLTADLVSRLLNIAPMICPRQSGGFGRGLGFDSFIFYRKIINCLQNVVKYGRKANKSTKSCSDISE